MTCVLVLAAVGTTSILAQPSAPEQDMTDQDNDDVRAIEAVVIALFDAMRAGDGDQVRSLFVEGTVLQSAGERDGVPQLGNTPTERFADAVDNAEGPIWDERIWDLTIHVDDRLASAWMNFAFYRGDTFSHCGVNSMQLFKGDVGWKIFHLADTRRREGCEIPNEVKNGVN